MMSLFFRFVFVAMVFFMGFKEPASAAGWDDLPDDIKAHIVSKLENEQDVGSLAQVNRNLNEVAKKPAAWEGVASKYDLKFLPSSPLNELIAAIIHKKEEMNCPPTYVKEWLRIFKPDETLSLKGYLTSTTRSVLDLSVLKPFLSSPEFEGPKFDPSLFKLLLSKYDTSSTVKHSSDMMKATSAKPFKLSFDPESVFKSLLSKYDTSSTVKHSSDIMKARSAKAFKPLNLSEYEGLKFDPSVFELTKLNLSEYEGLKFAPLKLDLIEFEPKYDLNNNNNNNNNSSEGLSFPSERLNYFVYDAPGGFEVGDEKISNKNLPPQPSLQNFGDSPAFLPATSHNTTEDKDSHDLRKPEEEKEKNQPKNSPKDEDPDKPRTD